MRSVGVQAVGAGLASDGDLIKESAFKEYVAGLFHHCGAWVAVFVNPVTRGERLAAFFWIESLVREDSQRSLLHAHKAEPLLRWILSLAPDVQVAFEALHERFPRLIVSDISGYGEGGPLRSTASLMSKWSIAGRYMPD